MVSVRANHFASSHLDLEYSCWSSTFDLESVYGIQILFLLITLSTIVSLAVGL